MVPVPCVRYETAPLVQTGFWDIETAAARSNMHTAPSCSKARFTGPRGPACFQKPDLQERQSILALQGRLLSYYHAFPPDNYI